MANSSRLLLAMMMAPACRRRDITVASYGGSYVASIREPHEVRSPRVLILSLTTIGTPKSGLLVRRSSGVASIRLAARSACSRATVINAPIHGSTLSIRLRLSLQISTAEVSPEAIAVAIPAAVCGSAIGFSRRESAGRGTSHRNSQERSPEHDRSGVGHVVDLHATGCPPGPYA